MERFGPTRRGGPVFRWLGEPLAIDFANTVMVVRHGESVDLLSTPSQLEAWLAAESERLGSPRMTASQVGELVALRDAVREVFTAAAARAPLPAAPLKRLNTASRAAPVAPQLAVDADGIVTISETPVAGTAFDRMLGRLARAAMEVVAGDNDQLNLCTAPSCGMFFVGSRRWCCRACGNRARVARHYARQHR